MEKKYELRSIECKLAIREAADPKEGESSRTIVGRAIVFNTESQVLDDWGMRFREIIAPEAVTPEWLKTQDIKLNMLHDRSLTLARCNKGEEGSSLRLTVDEEGVNFEFDAPQCDLGDRCLALVRSGVYSGCSFEFYPDKYDVEERAKDDILITHRAFKALTAITVGMDPAYVETSVNAREIASKTPEAVSRAEEQKREHDKLIEREMQERLAHLESLRTRINYDF